MQVDQVNEGLVYDQIHENLDTLKINLNHFVTQMIMEGEIVQRVDSNLSQTDLLNFMQFTETANKLKIMTSEETLKKKSIYQIFKAQQLKERDTT